MTSSYSVATGLGALAFGALLVGVTLKYGTNPRDRFAEAGNIIALVFGAAALLLGGYELAMVVL